MKRSEMRDALIVVYVCSSCRYEVPASLVFQRFKSVQPFKDLSLQELTFKDLSLQEQAFSNSYDFCIIDSNQFSNHKN